MEVSGKLHVANFNVLNELETDLIFCEPCKECEVSKCADGKCKQCVEYMCCICFKNHLVARWCRKHELIDSEGLQVNLKPKAECENNEVCSKHENEIIIYYCRLHDDIACGECMLFGDHKSCTPKLIKDLSANFQQSEDFRALSERIDSLEIRTNSTTSMIKIETENNSKMSKTAETEIRMLMGEIRGIIDETEKYLLSKVNEMHLQNDETLKNAALMNISTGEDIHEVKRTVNPLMYADNMLFIKSKQCKQTLVEIEKKCVETLDRNLIRRYEFGRDDTLIATLTSEQAFGTLSDAVQKIDINQYNKSNYLNKSKVIIVDKNRPIKNAGHDAAMYNNNQLSASGLRNEHTDDDNRFNAAAHEEVMPVSMTRRPYELSNRKIIKKQVSDDVLYPLIEKERKSDISSGFNSLLQDVCLPPESLDLSDDQSLDLSDDVRAPAFGTAVIQNSEAVGFATIQNFIGTVVGPRKKGLIKISWSDGTIKKCKFGVDGQYDILVSEDQCIDSNEIKIGSLVVRGQDWRWKDQDGGEGNVGVVTKIDGPVVHVIWSHGGVGNYRYGYNKNNYRTEKHFAWYMEEERDQWKMFPKDVNDSIEQMYKSRHAGTFLVKMDTQSLQISIENMQARDTTNTQKAYHIERRELSEEEMVGSKP